MKSVNPFRERMPKELQERHFTDYMTEMFKLIMAEANNTNTSGVPLKCGTIVAFARKP
jgi:hypothetical protein